MDQLPQGVQAAIRNNGGGYLNHALFWKMMGGNHMGDPSSASKELTFAVEQQYGGWEQLKKEFNGKAATVFGRYDISTGNGLLNIFLVAGCGWFSMILKCWTSFPRTLTC